MAAVQKEKKKTTKTTKTKKKSYSTKSAGRPGKYTLWLQPDNLEKVRNWRRNGATLDELSQLMHVGKTAIKEWQNRFPTFADALKESEIYDDQAENTLHKLGVEGWVTQEVVEEVMREADGTPITDADGNPKLVVTKRITKQIPPQTTALIFWLKCRRPEIWREKKEIYDASVEEVGGTIEIPALAELEVPDEYKNDMDTTD